MSVGTALLALAVVLGVALVVVVLVYLAAVASHTEVEHQRRRADDERWYR